MSIITDSEINDRSKFENDKSLKPSHIEKFTVLFCIMIAYIILGMS